MSSNSNSNTDNGAAKQYFAAYQYHSNLLRTWLVAYGIGGPVLFLTNDSLWDALVESGSARLIGGMFLLGVGFQVFLAALNKIVMWTLYYGEELSSFQSRARYRIADWVSEQFWIDFIVDIASLGFLGGATWKLFVLLGNTV